MRIIYTNASLPRFTAHTIPPIGIFINKEKFDKMVPINQKRLIRHEIEHWNQYKRLGLVKFYLLYFVFTVRYGYRNNPMEIEARESEREVL